MNLKSRLTSLTRNQKKIVEGTNQNTIDSKLSGAEKGNDNDIDENICDDIYSSLKKINKVKKKSLCQIDIDKYKSSDEVTKLKAAFIGSKKSNLDNKAIDY